MISLISKAPELKLYVVETEPDIICINETKLNGRVPPKIPGYKVACIRDRADTKLAGGGVTIYAKNQLNVTDISPNIDDTAAILLHHANQDIAIVSYYCPPQPEINLNTAMIDDYLHTYKNTIITGDLNAKHEYFGSRKTDTRGDVLFDLIERNEALVTNRPDQHTRFDLRTGKSDLVDYIIVSKNLAGKFISCNTGEHLGSDHLPVHAHVRLRARMEKINKRKVRALKNCNWDIFIEQLEKDNERLALFKQPLTKEVIEEKILEIEYAISQALNIACPLKEVKEYAFEVSEKALRLIRLKRTVRRLAQSNNTFKNAYYKLQRRVKEVLRKEKETAWRRATASLNEKKGKEFWNTFKQLTSTSKSSSNVTPTLILNPTAGKTKTDAEVAEAFAKSLQ